MFSPERKKEIADRLNEKFRHASCPMCRHNSFTMLDDYLTKNLQPNFHELSIGGPVVPTVAIVCTNCGFISEHALGVLGLVPPDETKKPNDGAAK